MTGARRFDAFAVGHPKDASREVGPVLVLGGTGRVGRLVAGYLAAARRPVRCLVRNLERGRSTLGAHVQCLHGDFRDPRSLGDAMRGVSAVFLATPIRPDLAAVQSQVIRTAAAVSNPAVVKLSGSPWTMVPGDMTCVGQAHAEVEAALRASGTHHVVVRPNAFTQTMLARVPGQIRDTGTFTLAMGASRVSFTDVRDIAWTCYLALVGTLSSGTVCDITGPSAWSGDELAKALTQHTGLPARYCAWSVDEAIVAARAAGADEFVLAHHREVLTRIMAGAGQYVTNTFADLTGRQALDPMAFLGDSLSIGAAEAAMARP